MGNKIIFKAIFVMLCVALIIITITITYQIQKEKEAYDKLTLTFKKPMKSYDIGTELSAVSFIVKTNADDIDMPNIDTSKVGEFSYVYVAYDKDGRHKEYVLVLNFIDPVLPIIILKETEVVITEGDSIDLENYIAKAYDPLEGNLKVKIKMPKDYKKVGKHQITYQVKDKNGNTNVAILRLVVNEKRLEDANLGKSPNFPQNGQNHATQPSNSGISNSENYLPAKKFLFADGYTMPGGSNSAFDVCTEYKGSAYGYCDPIIDSEGLYIGVEYKP